MMMISASIKKNDIKARWLIGVFSLVVFSVVTLLAKVKVNIDLGFDIHILAAFNAGINALIAVLLVAALLAVKKRNYQLHKIIMITALVLSVLFLLSYIIHKLFAGEARYGDANFDGVVDAAEKANVGLTRIIYLIILITHVFLAGIILPFILFTAYRGLIAEYPTHKKLARITWPLWFYVAVTGPVVYFLIKPYYQ